MKTRMDSVTPLVYTKPNKVMQGENNIDALYPYLIVNYRNTYLKYLNGVSEGVIIA